MTNCIDRYYGNEFLNHDLHSYFFNRKNRVEFVRRRAYKKNDNAHVEQKNWIHVRELFAYDRFDQSGIASNLDERYLSTPLEPYLELFYARDEVKN